VPEPLWPEKKSLLDLGEKEKGGKRIVVGDTEGEKKSSIGGLKGSGRESGA